MLVDRDDLESGSSAAEMRLGIRSAPFLKSLKFVFGAKQQSQILHYPGEGVASKVAAEIEVRAADQSW